jgi:hypothetical protein
MSQRTNGHSTSNPTKMTTTTGHASPRTAPAKLRQREASASNEMKLSRRAKNPKRATPKSEAQRKLAVGWSDWLGLSFHLAKCFNQVLSRCEIANREHIASYALAESG